MKKYHRWEDLAHKGTAEQMAKADSRARVELDRVGFGALRKAREQTQVELAATLGLPQSSISDIENRSDLLLSTLAKYVGALGGELQLRAVFPEAVFDLVQPECTQAKEHKKPTGVESKKAIQRKASVRSKRSLATAA